MLSLHLRVERSKCIKVNLSLSVHPAITRIFPRIQNVPRIENFSASVEFASEVAKQERFYSARNEFSPRTIFTCKLKIVNIFACASRQNYSFQYLWVELGPSKISSTFLRPK